MLSACSVLKLQGIGSVLSVKSVVRNPVSRSFDRRSLRLTQIRQDNLSRKDAEARRRTVCAS